MAKTKAKAKSAEIKPAPVAEVVNQTSQISKFQELTDEQQSQTPIEPDTVLIDKGIDEPVKEEPVVDPDAEDTFVNSDEIYPNQKNDFDKKAENKLAQPSLETKEPTRYGNGKEKELDSVDATPNGRHFPPPLHGNITGGKNEYPR